MKIFPCIFLLACLGLGCEKFELDRQEAFVKVQMFPPEALAIDSARVSAEVLEWQGVTPILDHGFVWFTPDGPEDQRLPDLFFNQGRLPLGAKTVSESPLRFEAVLSSLTPITPYVFRSYVSIGEEVFYSTPQTYQSGTGSVTTLAPNYQTGFEVELKGKLEGTEKGLLAVKHGFCWSTLNAQPTLDDNFVNLGNRRTNEPYSFNLEGLVNEQKLYFCAYAIFQANLVLDTIYGQVMPFEGDLNFFAQLREIGGGPRAYATGFSIGNKGYIGTGRDADILKNDFWEYDPQTNIWTQRMDVGGGPREFAVGFAIDNKGYIGTGNSSDFWEYDPQTNMWRERKEVGGGPRRSAVGFAIGNKGYIGTGFNPSFEGMQDFWEYNPQTDNWVPLREFGGGPRGDAVGFAIGNKGYIGTGLDLLTLSIDSLLKNDFWEYDPLTDNWAQLASLEGDPRANPVGFSIGNLGYIGLGSSFNPVDRFILARDIWKYDPQTNTWSQLLTTGLTELGVREGAVGFSLGNKGYIGAGRDEDQEHMQDFWVYDP